MPVATESTRADRRRRTATAAVEENSPTEAPLDPAPADADNASQPEIVEQVAAAVVETVIAATIQPTLPAPGRRSARAVTAAATADAVETPDVVASEALDVTVVDERRSGDDVAVILQSADATEATTPVALPTSPITLPVTRRSRRRPAAVDADEAPRPFRGETPPADAPRAETPRTETPRTETPRTETPRTETPGAEAPGEQSTADDLADEFEAAARLFAFTGATSVAQPTAEPVAQASRPVTEGLPVDAAPRRRNARRVAAASFSVGVMGLVGLMTVGMTMPVSALASASGTANVASADIATTQSLAVGGGDVSGGAIQAYVAPAQAQAGVVDRADGYSAATYAEMAAASGIKNFSNFFVNDPTAPIQWPFAVGVPITYGFGMRDGRMHEGVDFVPGDGSPVQAIADGTVRIATESGDAFGVTVLIDHEIDGQLISSRYAHMQYGSLQVVPGQKVTVGTFLGRTGNTGRSFGAHTHFELLQNGTTPIDPLPWLRQHTGG
ncbi:peptidoglycan DD-metalloendopeptidase family protein [Microbacterium enclense]|uniref:M23 family metallopeptidase n=1 Tax=Microbacterium enclense TaxID=993073 RepID=UPI0021A53BD3|nr:peptidoglycan DD-metalloendopeptidase family protein [Microbacterium enclense]MCT2085683.1 peptidoglycan DD-metalloendopeptidase family protein [Microbacterium enclense]